jgi:hypothetical protein
MPSCSPRPIPPRRKKLREATQEARCAANSARTAESLCRRQSTPAAVLSKALADGGKPRVIQVLKRGDMKTTREGSRAWQPSRRSGNSSRYPSRSLVIDESARRAALAKWITDKNNALTWRSIVNRVWQHHFGRGLVETANDFGRMGGKPATLSCSTGWQFGFAMTWAQLKKLHKLIVMSETYRQSSDSSDQSASLPTPPTNTLALPPKSPQARRRVHPRLHPRRQRQTRPHHGRPELPGLRHRQAAAQSRTTNTICTIPKTRSPGAAASTASSCAASSSPS